MTDTAFNLDEAFTNAKPLTIRIEPKYNRLKGTGLFGVSLVMHQALYDSVLRPVIDEVLDAQIILLGRAWYINGVSWMINVDATRADSLITIDLGCTRDRKSVGNLRALPGLKRYIYESDYDEPKEGVTG